MKKSAIITFLILVVLTIVCIPPLKAQTSTQNIITINADGTITPSTAPIRQEASTYTLTEDFEGSILIQGSNIVLNGAGHSVYTSEKSQYGVRLLNVSNVTIKNMTVRGSDFGYIRGVELADCTNCTIINSNITDVWSILGLNGILYVGVYVSGGNSNVFSRNSLVNNSMAMYFLNSPNNVVTENSITYIKHGVDSSTSGISFNNASDNVIYHNNFRAEFGAQADAYKSSNFWDNGYPSGGNYWIDYRVRYPNATVIDNSGIGDTPYDICDQNRDNYPLMEPFNASAIVEASPTPSVNPTASEPNGNTAMDNIVMIGVVAAFVVVLAVAGLVVYFKRRRH